MSIVRDGPGSPLCTPLTLHGNATLATLPQQRVSRLLAESARLAPSGDCVCWGIPFDKENLVLAKDDSVNIDLPNLRSKWLLFSHVSDLSRSNATLDEFVELGSGRVPVLGPMSKERAADYIFCYADGTEVRVEIRGGRHIAPFATRLDENCFEAVAYVKSMSTRWGDNESVRNQLWGRVQQQNFKPDLLRFWVNWLWAWENPHPEKRLVGIRIEPVNDAVVVFGISASDLSSTPLRWRRRRKLLMRLDDDEQLDPGMQHHTTQGVMLEEVVGGNRHIDIDMGQIISVQARKCYPDSGWSQSALHELPELSSNDLMIEYSSHADAHFHLPDQRTLSVREFEAKQSLDRLQTVPPALQKVRIRVLDNRSGRPLSAKLHVHGEAGEYLAPTNRDRLPNRHWFQDYGADYVHKSTHVCTYIDGVAEILLPEGTVYIEVSKGFEVRPLRTIATVDGQTEQITLELDNVLNWRERGWVTADTHVHFLSPQTALLEGAAEGVNIVNLLASQWGEMFTNVGDFDGKTTFGEHDSDTDGEYLLRVGTENRQGVMGHISLLGYGGEMIGPLASGGPSESALGDPVAALLTDWAARCKAQGGTVVVPHFPLPRGEHAATIVAGLADAVELTSLGPLARGSLNAYDLADWYRYLNCGYFVAAVGGTDKMSASTAVGAGRTYARLRPDEAFDYPAWQRAITRGQTFATLGPLVDFSVEGNPPGTRMKLPRAGGTVDVCWEAESVILPMTSLELIVNGEIRESSAINAASAAGSWQVKLDQSSWLAILIRGREPGQNEVIGAHTSPVMVTVEGSEFMAAADALSILEQIEGSMAYLDTLGTRADSESFRKMRLLLTGVHRQLHDRMHEAGVFHKHNAVTHHKDHDEH